jgi:hypothetical protein
MKECDKRKSHISSKLHMIYISYIRAEVKEKVRLYFYSPSVPSRPVLGRTFALPLPW